MSLLRAEARVAICSAFAASMAFCLQARFSSAEPPLSWPNGPLTTSLHLGLSRSHLQATPDLL